MTNLLTEADAAAAWGALEASQAVAAPHADARAKPYHYYKPFAQAADEFIREAQDQNRVFTGQAEFDAEMRGIGSGHLMVVVGYTHSGKTQWVVGKPLRHNKHKRILIFSPDEPRTLTLAKLASIEAGVPSRELEVRVAAGDQVAIDLLRNTALVDFPNLIVFDRPLTPQMMRDGYSEACDVWGDEPDLMVVDYVDLVQAGDSPPAKFDFLKAFNSERNGRMIAIHQTSRSAGADGKEMTISSGNYGGEQHATFMVGIRRKKSGLESERKDLMQRVAKGSEAASGRLAEVEYDLKIHQFTTTANLVKNKRPGGGLVDDIDLEIDRDTGRLYDLHGDLPSQYLALREKERAAAPKPRSVSPPVPYHQEPKLNYEGDF